MYGKLLITVGIILIVLGIVMNYAPWMVNWIGKLPGDIRIEDENKSIFIPIPSALSYQLSPIFYFGSNKYQFHNSVLQISTSKEQFKI